MVQNQDLSPLPTATYTPESRLRRPQVLIQEIWTDLKVSRELSWQLFRRKLSTRYRQTALGPLWVLVPPAVTALMATLLRSSGVVDVASDGVLPYFLRVMFATVVWGVFAQSLSLPLQAMQESLVILQTMRVSVEGFLLAKVAEILFDQGFQFLVLAVLFTLFKVPISIVGLLSAGMLLTLLIALGMSLGFFLVPVGSLYLDVNSALPLLLRGWFFLTPVIFPKPAVVHVSDATTEAVTDATTAVATQPQSFLDLFYSTIVSLNPVSSVLQGILDTTVGEPLQDIWNILGVLVLTVVLFSAGWLVYRVSIPLLVER
ncbi:MAG: ABC transporter permease [Merismopedia sp. SIO2A8]|nr:ABC transporter permease [Merismopedia sp. SIO2A8]